MTRPTVQLLREPKGREKRPQAAILARKQKQ